MTTLNPNIAKLTPSDAACFREIRLEALQSTPEAFGSTYEHEASQALSWFEERLSKTVVLGCFDESQLVGTAGFFVQQGAKVQHKGVLWGMYVQPKARGGGVGQMLLKAVMDHAAPIVEQIQLTVVRENLLAYKLYKRNGFEEYGTEIAALKYNGQYFDEVLMVKHFRRL